MIQCPGKDDSWKIKKNGGEQDSNAGSVAQLSLLQFLLVLVVVDAIGTNDFGMVPIPNGAFAPGWL
jgi:hypothetical protein